MAKKKVTAEAEPEAVSEKSEVVAETIETAPETVSEKSEVVVETIEVKSPISDEANLNLANLGIQRAASVNAMKPYDQRTVQVTKRSEETMHFNRIIIREDFK